MVLIKRTALLLIILPLVGSIFSCLYFTARIRGTFTEWEAIGRPDTMPIKLIQMNYVQTKNGDIYEYQYEYGKPCKNNCWIKVDTIPPILNRDELLPLENCQNSLDVPSVGHFSDSVIECWRWGTGTRLDIQAIEKTGMS